MQRDREKQFTYGYLPGTHLLQTLVKPNNMTLTQSYEEKRDLFISQLYKRSNASVASRTYTYDTLGRPMTRSISKNGSTVNDSFGYNSRSELNTALVNNEAYAYDYDNIGNRETAQEAAESATTYDSNQLNQYTAIGDFDPTYDEAGNQTTVKTSTGIWSVVYNAENRPTSFTNADSGTVVECTYDYMGRRATKKVTVNGNVTLHQRFLYRGYLQIACCDLTRSNHPCLWLITWDPSQSVATRSLAIQKDGTWYTYGWDLTKNICEVYGQHGYIRTAYTYAPYGEVTSEGDVTQPIQWSSEYNDTELGLIYYNYRHYNPVDGRWIGRDMLPNQNEYFYSSIPITKFDILGRKEISIEVTKIAHPNIVYVTANDIKKYARIANILGKIDHGDGSFFATTHGVIKPNHFILKCKCENKLWKPNYIKVWPSILILINKPRIAKMFHGAPAGLEEFKNFEMSYIPSNDGTKGADPIKILQYEMDHYRDLRAWFNGVGFHDSIGKKIQELTKKYKVYQSQKDCEAKLSLGIKIHLREEYIKIATLSHNKYDVGPNAPHVVDGDYPNIAM